MQAVILGGGSVLINCRYHTVLATTISQIPPDEEILECFPLVPRLEFSPESLYANAIGILGKYFSGTPDNEDTIQYDSVEGVWKFVPLTTAMGTIAVNMGGTGLSSIPNNSILYSTSINTFAATSVGTSLGVSSGTINVINDTSTQKVEIAGNANLFGARKRVNFINGANTTVSVTDDPTNNKIDVAISASASAGSRWEQLANPIADLSLSHGGTTTTFTWGNATAANSLFQLKDSNNNSGNGYLLDVNTGNSSTINPLRVAVSGTSNGIIVDSAGKLSAIGSGQVEASSIKGISTDGIVVRSGTSFVSRQLATTNVNHITITNVDGILGNPTLSLGGDVVVGVGNDTNVRGSISSNILTLSWLGTLAKSRQNSATVYNDQSNTYVAGNKQFFVPNATNAAFNIGGVSGNPSALSNGDFWVDSLTGKIKYYEQGTAFELSQLTKGRKNLIDETAVSIFEVDLSNLTSTAMVLNYALHASDGTNVQVRSGSIRFSAVNKNGTIVTESFIDTEGIAPSVGTLTVLWQIINGIDKITIQATGNTSLTANTFYVSYSVDNLSDRTITKL